MWFSFLSSGCPSSPMCDAVTCLSQVRNAFVYLLLLFPCCFLTQRDAATFSWVGVSVKLLALTEAHICIADGGLSTVSGCVRWILKCMCTCSMCIITALQLFTSEGLLASVKVFIFSFLFLLPLDFFSLLLLLSLSGSSIQKFESVPPTPALKYFPSFSLRLKRFELVIHSNVFWNQHMVMNWLDKD